MSPVRYETITIAVAEANVAPVLGSIGDKGVDEQATLTFMCGGDKAVFEKAKPILQNMGKNIVLCGGPGQGQVVKICNNMILGISMIAVGEAFTLAEKLGLSHQALFDVASTSSGQCWSLTTYCPVPGPVPTSPANNGYKPGFAAALMLSVGIKRTMLGGLFLMSAATFASLWMSEPWQYVLSWGVVSGVGSGAVASVLGAAVVNRWFATRQGLVMGMLTAARWRWDHKSVFSLLAWAVFAALLAGRLWRGWRGRRRNHGKRGRRRRRAGSR